MTDDDDIGLLKDQCDQYTLLEIVWHLCEVLFVETLPAGCLIQQLLEWVGTIGSCDYIIYDNVVTRFGGIINILMKHSKK